jgi:hypothetical protein
MTKVATYFPDDDQGKSAPRAVARQLTREESQEWLRWYMEYKSAVVRGERPECRTRDSFAK